MNPVSEFRIRPGNRGSLNEAGEYVLYWMTAFRRLDWNFALQHALNRAGELGKPLVILEVLLVDYPYASPRLHQFMLEGMRERSLALANSGVTHYPFVERERGEGRGLAETLASKASLVVMDDYPTFILPGLAEHAGRSMDVSLEMVDSNGILPLRATTKVHTAAYHFRRFLQKTLPEWLGDLPHPDPLSQPPPRSHASFDPGILHRWPKAAPSVLHGGAEILDGLPLDPSVPALAVEGGSGPARNRLDRFLAQGLSRYHEERNHPDRGVTSGLSPYLHFGNISAHEVFSRVVEEEGWTPLRLSHRTDGARSGWWGMSPGGEAFLDQLVTWRELGFNMAYLRKDVAAFESLPEWAIRTLEEHEGDPRPHLYSPSEFRDAETHDPLWNAAQRQLLREGIIHNYLRMLWGKKILEWSASPRDALETMVDLNDRFALDGRDPNSYSGIFWCLGRYDRGWQERPVFGKVRSMSSERTAKKVELEDYLRRFGP